MSVCVCLMWKSQLLGAQGVAVCETQQPRKIAHPTFYT